jgi:hypothetical protein
MNIVTKVSLGTITSLAMLASVAGASFAQTVPSSNYQLLAKWPYETDAKCYQLFYKETGAASWQFAVRCKDLKNPVWQYLIQGLKPNTSYTYKVREISTIGNANQYRWITNDVTERSQLPTTVTNK